MSTEDALAPLAWPPASMPQALADVVEKEHSHIVATEKQKWKESYVTATMTVGGLKVNSLRQPFARSLRQLRPIAHRTTLLAAGALDRHLVTPYELCDQPAFKDVTAAGFSTKIDGHSWCFVKASSILEVPAVAADMLAVTKEEFESSGWSADVRVHARETLALSRQMEAAMKIDVTGAARPQALIYDVMTALAGSEPRACQCILFPTLWSKKTCSGGQSCSGASRLATLNGPSAASAGTQKGKSEGKKRTSSESHAGSVSSKRKKAAAPKKRPTANNTLSNMWAV